MVLICPCKGGLLEMKIVSWNVNGIIACRRKGFLRFLANANPDIVCCQEIKTQCALNTPGYHQFWNPAKRPGYSGTLVLSKRLPLSWTVGMDCEEFDAEGRLITLEYQDFYVVNVYVPSVHPHNAPDRPDYRLEFLSWRYAECRCDDPATMGEAGGRSLPANAHRYPAWTGICICRAAVRLLKRSAGSPGYP